MIMSGPGGPRSVRRATGVARSQRVSVFGNNERGNAMDAAIEASTMRKVYMRLLPFAMLSYVLAYIDRINVSFAALTMRDDLHMSAGDFGFAVGTFYWAYFLFEVPSNVILEKVGARLWIARIMITWGIRAFPEVMAERAGL